MKRTKIVIGLVVFSYLVACGKPPEKHVVPSDPPPPRPNPSPNPNPNGNPKCDTRDDRSLDPKRDVQRKTIELKRQRQRVVRRDCDRKVLSDQMELIHSPSAEVVIRPVRVKDSDLSGSAYNRNTCDMRSGGLTVAIQDIFSLSGWFDRSPKIKFIVNSSPTFDHMHVLKGEDNYIDYAFTKCADKIERGMTCNKYEVVEQGTLILTVNYSEPPDIETPLEVIKCDKDSQKKP